MSTVSLARRQDVLIEAGTPLAELCDRLTEVRSGVIGCIAYGSCLRSGEIFAGLFDVYLVVTSYSKAHRSRLAAGFNGCCRRMFTMRKCRSQAAWRGSSIQF